MSTKLTGYVWDGCAASGMKLSSVAIMARLADFSNDEGVCWPSIETIARQIGAGMSTVRTAIARLEAEGWLTRKARRQGNRNASNVYQLNVAKLQAATFSQLSDSDPSKSDASKSDQSKFDASKSGKKAGFHPSESGGDPSVKSKHDPSDKKPSRPDASQPDTQTAEQDFLTRHPDAVVFSPKKRQWGTQDDLTCAQWLWKKIIALYEQAAECDGEVVRPKEPNWTAWANEIRLMCVQDGRTHKQICEMYSRVSRDPFWCRNVLSPSKLREKWDELSLRLSPSVSTYTEKREDPYFKSSYDNVDYSQIPAGFRGVIMSLLNDVQKFIEAHPGCTSGDIADAFAGYSRQRVLQSASKLRQSGRVAHRCEGDTRRHFPRLTERAQEPEPQPVRETRPVRNFYVGTNDPRVILCLTRQAEELESRGLYRRAATVWMAAFRESHSQPERNNFLARREQCLRKSSKRAVSSDEWYLSGNYVGA